MADQLEQNVSGLTIRIDRTRCIGSANCVKLAPDVFELDDSSLVRFVEQPAAMAKEELIDACAVCPVDALTVVTQEGKQIVP